jgi:hypothetical protein
MLHERRHCFIVRGGKKNPGEGYCRVVRFGHGPRRRNGVKHGNPVNDGGQTILFPELTKERFSYAAYPTRSTPRKPMHAPSRLVKVHSPLIHL